MLHAQAHRHTLHPRREACWLAIRAEPCDASFKWPSDLPQILKSQPKRIYYIKVNIYPSAFTI
jgi:hypothetical protein